MYPKILSAITCILLAFYFYNKVRLTLTGDFLLGELDSAPKFKSKYCKARAIIFSMLGFEVISLIISEYFLTFLAFEHYLAAAELLLIIITVSSIPILNKKYLGRTRLKN